MLLPTCTRRSLVTVLIAALWLVSAVARPAFAADKWIEIKTEHFTIVSNDRERDARDIGFQFEQFRTALQMAFPWAQVQLDRPVQVIAVRGEATMKALAPQYWEVRGGTRPASVFMTTPDAHRILIRLDVTSSQDANRVNPYQSAYWSYAGLILQASFQRGLPLWLTNGLSSVLSNTMIDGRGVQFGRQIPWLAQRATAGTRVPLAQLIEVTQDSPFYRNQDTRQAFDAYSWGLAQYMFSGARDRGAKLNELSTLILAGTASQAAIEKVYGSLSALESAVDTYLHQAVYQFLRMDVDIDRSLAKSPVRVLDAAEAAAAQASFHVAMGRTAEARTLLAEARKANAALTLIDDAEAMLLDREQKPDEARAAYQKAAAAGSQNFYVHYRLGALLQPAAVGNPADIRVLAGHAERAASLNPDFAPALGVLSNAHLMLGEHNKALDTAVRAAKLRPGDVYYRILAGRALLQLGQREEAARLAREALPLAKTPQDQRALEQIVEIAGRPAAGPPRPAN